MGGAGGRGGPRAGWEPGPKDAARIEALDAALHGGGEAVARLAAEAIRGRPGAHYEAMYAVIRARALLSAGRREEARRAAEECAAGGGDEIFWIELGDLLEDLGDPAGSLGAYEMAEAAACVHTAPDASTCRANALAGLGRHEEGVAAADAALAADPGHGPALAAKAVCLAALGRHAEALGPAEACMAAGHDSGAEEAAAACLAEAGRDAEALALADRTIRDGFPRGPTWYTKARLLARLGRHEECLDALTVAASLGAGLAARAAGEADFGPVRDNERFARITGRRAA